MSFMSSSVAPPVIEQSALPSVVGVRNGPVNSDLAKRYQWYRLRTLLRIPNGPERVDSTAERLDLLSIVSHDLGLIIRLRDPPWYQAARLAVLEVLRPNPIASPHDHRELISLRRRKENLRRAHARKARAKDFPVEVGPEVEVPDELECSICMVGLKDTMFIPCLHVACCSQCAQVTMRSTKKCPICRHRVVKTEKVGF
jgi:hypothetical protein